MSTMGARGIGIANIALDGSILDTWFPHPEMIATSTEQTGTVRLGAAHLSPKFLSLVRLDEDRMVEQIAVETIITDLDEPPIDAHDAYLRLHLLSHRMVRPNEINLEGMFNVLTSAVWTNKGPCLPENFEFVRTSLRSRGLIHVYGVDVLPRMVDYCVPADVYIAQAERVRLGAYLAPRTQVRREGFVSFNAGTLGPSIVEGRISSGVVLGDKCEVGLSASIMGPRVSDTTRAPLSIGNQCVFGVNASVMELSLGSRCVIGDNVTIRPTTQLRIKGTDELIDAASIEGQDDWRITHEPGYIEPVAQHMS